MPVEKTEVIRVSQALREPTKEIPRVRSIKKTSPRTGLSCSKRFYTGAASATTVVGGFFLNAQNLLITKFTGMATTMEIICAQ